MKPWSILINLWEAYNAIVECEEFCKQSEMVATIITSELKTIINMVRVWADKELQISDPHSPMKDVDEALYFFAVVVIAIENTNYAAHCVSKLTIIAQMLDRPFFLFGLQAAFEGTPPHKERMKQFAKELQPKITKKLATMAERTDG